MQLPEPELLDGMRCFPTTQELFLGSPAETHIPNPMRIGWYDTNIHPLRGAFAVVRRGSGLDLVGDFLQVTYRGTLTVRVYCVSEVDTIEQDLAIQRRPYLAMERLSVPSILAYARVIE